MLIAEKKLQFTPSSSPDVVGHRIFVANTPLDYNSPHEDIPVPTAEYNFPGGFVISEGQYNVGLCSYDAANNQSDIVEVPGGYFFDFSAPLAPTNLSIV